MLPPPLTSTTSSTTTTTTSSSSTYTLTDRHRPIQHQHQQQLLKHHLNPPPHHLPPRKKLTRQISVPERPSLPTPKYSQPKLSQRSWGRSRSHQSITLCPPRRTILEWLPREVVFLILGHLSFPDIQNLLKVDRRLRPFVHSKSFAPWRKRLASFQHHRSLFDNHVFSSSNCGGGGRGNRNHDPAGAPLLLPASSLVASHGSAAEDGARPSSGVEADMLSQYSNALSDFGMTDREPTEIYQLVPALKHARPGSASASCLTQFGERLLVGLVGPAEIFTLLPEASAIDVLCFVRLFLAVLRISQSFSACSGGAAAPSSQLLHFLDADCREAITDFFSPRHPNRPRPSGGAGASPRRFELTEEQRRFVETDVVPGQVVKVQAFAGTGKTRSLLAYAESRPAKRFLYIAFNVSAANSARQRFPSNVDCRTMHSVALKQVSLAENQPLGSVRPKDVVELMAGRLPEGKETKESRSTLLDARSSGDGKLSPMAVATYVLRTLQRFLYSDDTEIDKDIHLPRNMITDTDLSPEKVVGCTRELWEMIKSGKDSRGNTVRCPHDAYVKLLHLRGALEPDPFFSNYDVLLLDEAQDLSAAQAAILLRARKQCGILVVGDVYQKIYGFRGGTAKAFNDRVYPPTARFELTQSFRFGDSVAGIATKILGLKANPPWDQMARKPLLRGVKGLGDKVYYASSRKRSGGGGDEGDGEGDSPTLSPTLLDLSGQNPVMPRPPAALAGFDRVEVVAEKGKEVGRGRGSVLEEDERESLRHTRIYRTNCELTMDAIRLSTRLALPHKIYLKTSQNLQPKAMIDLLRDGHILYHNQSKSMSRGSILREFSSWKELAQRVEADEGGGGESQLGFVYSLESMFEKPDLLQRVGLLESRFCGSEAEATVVLSTVHQAKGLEWERVLVADDFRPNLHNPRTDGATLNEISDLWSLDEVNHMYVALTRAKKELVVGKQILEWLVSIQGFQR
ncbi:P-loop containing nucleoside triphosphate hydrolase protein, partial [Violaceomyces palustris]